MKKLLLLLVFFFPAFIQAQDIVIDERITDIYYANGIMNTERDAYASLDLIRNAALQDIYSNDESAMLRETDYKLLYNESYGSYVPAPDMLEAFMQKKQDHRWFWVAIDVVINTACGHIQGASPKEIARDAAADLIKDLIADPVQDWLEITFLDNLIDLILGVITRDICSIALDSIGLITSVIHDIDFTAQLANVRESVRSGRHVIVTAHSQGNLFFNEIYNALDSSDWWMTKYVNTIAVASPSSNVLEKATAVVFDNDPVVYVWGEEKGVIANPLRHVSTAAGEGQTPPCSEMKDGIYFRDDANLTSCLRESGFEADYNLTSLQFHAFEYYMSPVLSANGIEKPNPSYEIIINALKANIKASEIDFSQWKVKKNSACSAVPSCSAKLKYVEHRYDESLNDYMRSLFVYPFTDMYDSKVYPIKGLAGAAEYVKADSFYGYRIEDQSVTGDNAACFALKDENNKTLETIDDSLDAATKPASGYVEVSVAWENADIDIDLRVMFPGGTHDVQDECQLMEHFYALNDKEVTPGLYPVYITYGAYGDNKEISASQKELQNIVVTIKVPGTTEARTVNLKTIDSLPKGGHIADIKVEQRKVEVVLKDNFRTGSTVLYYYPESGYSSSVGGGGGGGSGGGGGGYSWGYGYGGGGGGSAGWGYTYVEPPVTNDYIYSIIWHISQALLGPLAGANISIYALEDYDVSADKGSNPIYLDTSSYGLSVYTAGVINIPRTIIDALDDEKIYVIEVKGGTDIDANDDKITDAAPVTNLGTVRALASGNALKNIGFKVNILTEMAYQISKKRYDKNDISKLTNKSDEAIKCLLNSDINLDGVTNTVDALYFTPYSDKGKLYANYNGEFMPIVRKIHKGGNIYEDSFNLYARPLVKGGYFSVNESAAIGSVTGRIETDCVSESPVHSFILSGDGADRFQTDSDGNIKIAKRLVYEERRIYRLSVVGINAYGTSPSSDVYITVTADNSPVITNSLTSYAFENMPNGSPLGQIGVNDMGYPVTGMGLEGFGAGYFNIDNKGAVTVAQGEKISADDKEYALSVWAENAFGRSAPSTIKLTIHDDAPVILNDIYATIREDTAKGAAIAKPSYYRGLSNVKMFNIEGFGAENFDISADGVIKIAQEANISVQDSPYRLSIFAENEHGRSASRLATINVIPIPARVDNDDAPLYSITLYNFSTNIYATANANAVVGKISYSYGYALPTAFSLSGAGSERFGISSGGVITLINNSGLNAGEVFNLEANASNEYVSSAKSQVKITVIDDTPRLNNFSVSIMDGLEGGTAIGKVGYSYGTAPVTKFELEGAEAADFTIDNDGTIKIKDGTVIDYDVKNLYTFTIKGINTAGRTAQSSASVKVTDDAPTLRESVFSVMENSYGGEYVGRVTIASNGRSVITSFVLSGEGAEMFEIDKSGNIKTAAGSVIDYETKRVYNLKAAAANAYDTSKEAGVTINVINVPDQEPVLTATALSVDENSPAGTYVGDMGIFASGHSAITSFTITGTNADWFAIDSAGKVTTTSLAKLDYESKRVFNLKVKAISDYGESAGADLKINVNNVPDLPPVVSGMTSYINENSPADTFVGQLTILSADSPVTSITLSGTGAENFKVDNNGTITVAEGAKLDYESNDRYHPQAKAVNAFGESNTANISIYINNVPDRPPVVSGVTSYIDENLPADTFVGQLTIFSADSPVTSITLSGTGAENFKVDNNGTITVAEGAKLDYESARYYSLYAKAVNAFGESNAAYTLIWLNNVPDRPPVVYSIVYYVDENSPADTFIGQLAISDDDSPVTSITLSRTGAENFKVDNNGTITVAEGAKLDYESNYYYHLYAKAVNAFGESNAADILIYLNNVPDNPPVLQDTYLNIHRKTPANKTVGTITVNSPIDCSITKYVIDDNPVFGVRNNGEIYTKTAVMKDSNYAMSVYAKSVCGDSNTVSLTIDTQSSIIGRIKTGGSTYSVVLSSDETKAFVAAYSGGLQIIDVSEPYNPSLIGQIAIGCSTCNNIALSSDNTKAFTTSYNSLMVVDVSEPTNPAIISQIYTGGSTRGGVLSSDDTKAFVTADLGGLRVIDVSDPTNPAIIGQIDIGGSTRDIVLSSDNTKAFVAAYSGGLQIIDVSDPTNPAIISQIYTGGYAYGVVLSSDETKAFVAAYSGGLQIIDVSEPYNPAIIGQIKTGGIAHGVVLSSDDTKAFVTTDSGSLRVIDVSEPTNPATISQIDIGGSTRGVVLSSDDTKAFVTNYYSGGLIIIDIEDFTKD